VNGIGSAPMEGLPFQGRESFKLMLESSLGYSDRR